MRCVLCLPYVPLYNVFFLNSLLSTLFPSHCPDPLQVIREPGSVPKPVYESDCDSDGKYEFLDLLSSTAVALFVGSYHVIKTIRLQFISMLNVKLNIIMCSSLVVYLLILIVVTPVCHSANFVVVMPWYIVQFSSYLSHA